MEEKNLKRGLGRIWQLSLSLAAVTVASSALSGIAPTVAYADTTSPVTISQQATALHFKDVPSTHWAKDAIAWGVQNGFLSGYPDGTFKPDEQMTEAEFASMYARYLNMTHSPQVPNAHWAQNAYNDLAKYEVPLKGYKDDKIKDTAVTRGVIAQVIAAKYGYKMTEKQAIYYMYATNLSSGMGTEKTYENYGANSPLTRAQAAAFLQRIDNMGVIYFIADSDYTFQENQYEISIKGDIYSRNPSGPYMDVTSTFVPHFSDFVVTDKDRALFPNVNVISADRAALFQILSKEDKLTQDLINEMKNYVVKINGLYVPGYGFDSYIATEGLWFTASLMPREDRGVYLGLTDKNAYEKAIRTWVDAGIITLDQYNKVHDFIEKYYEVETAPDSQIGISVPGPKHCIEARANDKGIGVGIWYTPTN